MDLRSSLIEFLGKARKRSILHLLLDYLVLSTAIALGGAVIVLLAGTEVLSWFWLVLVSAVTLAACFYLARRRFPSVYLVAQWIDARLKLADTLSTAAYFLKSPGNADANVRESQYRQAEHLAESVDLKQALPFTRPRAAYAAVALVILVAGVFLLRYVILGSFDPRTPLAQNALASLLRSAEQQQAKAGAHEDGNQPGDGREESKEAAKNSDFAGEPPSEPTPSTANNQKAQNTQQANDKDKPNESNDKSDSPTGNEQSKDKNEQGDKQDAKENAKANQDPSLLDKVREALNDMLNKMKSSPSESAKNQKGDQQNENEQQSGSDGQAQEKSDSQQKSGKQASDAQDAASAQNKSQEQQNGIGKQEGDKTAKQAEALKAMGKITELLGKRAENVKGAVMVEVGSTKQQLKTQVSQSQASHGEAGSEIHRDEVPPIYEEFVQQYFEQVRKNSSNSAPPPLSTEK